MNINKKGQALLTLIGLVVLTAFTAIVTTKSPVTRIAGFYTSTVAWDSSTGGAVGGSTQLYIAADTEKVGNVVYFSAANAVSKSATLANYNALAGVVVGGASSNMQALVGRADVAQTAALPNKRVWVTKCGRAWMITDSAITAGNLVIPSVVTAGYIHAKPALIDSFYRTIGRAVTTAAAAGTTLVNVCVK